MPLQTLAQNHFKNLQANHYPGRGIILGESPDASAWVQIYWIMGRSENSRNRIFVLNVDGSVRTQAHDPSKLTDPSLIIYHPARSVSGAHIITNGDQTDTIAQAMNAGGTFESALFTREFEPDAPNLTPRISGITYANGRYTLAILKSAQNQASLQGCQRQFFHYEKGVPGLGHFISTYATDGNPIPSFAGEPQWMPVMNNAEATLQQYWVALNEDNKVSLMVRWIDKKTFQATTHIQNKLA